MPAIACPCPPKADGTVRHPDGDEVTLRERLDFHAATTIRKGIGLLYLEDPGASTAEVLALLTEQYVLFGVRAWTVVDDRGKPIEVSKPAIREVLLSGRVDISGLADAADELYAPAVMLPLLAAAQSSSPPSPTDMTSTSATTTGPQRLPRPLRRSSTSTTRTGATGTITSLPGGVSSSSPSTKSAR
jgi:hypothetical protein